MNFLPILFSVLGALIVAGLLGWIRKSHLVVLVPRTFSYSQLTERGQIVEISVLNRGMKTEEAVDVVLNPVLKYELLAANTQDIQLNKNKIEIRRIASSDEATVLLVIEDGMFKPDDITQTVSKESKGYAVSKLEQVPLTWTQRVGAMVALVVFSVFVTGFLYSIGLFGEKESAAQKQETKNSAEKPAESFVVQDWIIPTYARSASGELLTEFESGKVKLTLSTLRRKGDLVIVPIKLVNNTNRTIRFSARMTSIWSEKRGEPWKESFRDVVAFPGQSAEGVAEIMVLGKTQSSLEKSVLIEGDIKAVGFSSLGFSKEITAD